MTFISRVAVSADRARKTNRDGHADGVGEANPARYQVVKATNGQKTACSGKKCRGRDYYDGYEACAA